MSETVPHNGHVKIPARVFEWLLLAALATTGGYAGSASADETAELRDDFQALADETAKFRDEIRHGANSLEAETRDLDRRLARLEKRRARRRLRARAGQLQSRAADEPRSSSTRRAH